MKNTRLSICFSAVSVFVFAVSLCFQFFSYKYYLFDQYYYDIFSNWPYWPVVSRSIGIALIWVGGFSLASLFYFWVSKKIGAVLLYAWAVCFGINIMLWFINLQILYYSGLFIRPILLQHVEGASGVIFSGRFYAFLFLSIGATTALVYFLRKCLFKSSGCPAVFWFYIYLSIAILASTFGVTIIASRSSPEYAIAKSFYKVFFEENKAVEMLPRLQEKLKRFGLDYDNSQFFVINRQNIYNDNTPLLPAKFNSGRPNVIVIFFESLSSRLTSVYNQELIGATPNLQSFADEPGSTVFKRFYNASSPTVTGLYSLLCSSLPAFDNSEVDNFNKFAGHHALCLPNVLKKSGGYKSAVYMMGQESKFASMKRMIENMGMDKVFSKEDLDGEIKSEAVYWGYEDHQLFPSALQQAKQLSVDTPFFLAVSTINTHPPFFDINGKAIPFGDGSNELLKSLHSTDDAFGQFWQEFKNSELYDNTILIAVADHSMFPGKQLNELIPSQSYYDENFFVAHIPDSILPREVDVLSSGIDFAPTLLQILGVNIKNSFEGRSIFDDRKNYPAVLGIAADGFYINENGNSEFSLTSDIDCPEIKNEDVHVDAPLTLCEMHYFYLWKKQMFEDGRLWEGP